MTGSDLQLGLNYTKTACGKNVCPSDIQVCEMVDNKIEEVMPESEMAELATRILGVRLLIDVACDGPTSNGGCNPRISRVDMRPISRLLNEA